MNQPVRLQLSRAKGSSLQILSRNTNGLEAVNVARPGRWGNPYKIGGSYPDVDKWGKPLSLDVLTIKDAAEAKAAYSNWIFMGWYIEAEEIAKELRGKNLACWCAPNEPCHADVLLEVANR